MYYDNSFSRSDCFLTVLVVRCPNLKLPVTESYVSIVFSSIALLEVDW